jgi:hypothetical protein
VTPPDAQACASGMIGEIEVAVFLGTCFNYVVRSGLVQVQAEGAIDRPFERGQSVRLHVPPDHCHAFSSPVANERDR